MPFRGQDRGTAMVEFALLAPVFLIAFAGTVDLGNAMYTQIRLESALAAGANYALLPASLSQVNSTNGGTLASNIASIVTGNNPGTQPNATVVVNNGPRATVTSGTPGSGGTAANANYCYCPTGSTPSWTWGASVSCGNACTGGGTAGQFVTITASYSFTPFFPIYGFVQGGTMTIGTLVQTQ
jgi:Flp pilus assembly protein TadG